MKKILAITLALAMILSLGIISAFADPSGFGVGVDKDATTPVINGGGQQLTDTYSASYTPASAAASYYGTTVAYDAIYEMDTFNDTNADGVYEMTWKTTFLMFDHDGDAATAEVPVPKAMVTGDWTVEDYYAYANKAYHSDTDGNTEGGTTVGVLAIKDTQVSFTVPLYVTLAVIADSATPANGKVYTPTNYAITNTSKNATIAVSGIATTKEASGTWTLSATAPTAAAAAADFKVMQLCIGDLQNGLVYDDTATADVDEGTIAGTSIRYDTGAKTGTLSTVFANSTTGTYSPILKNSSKALALTGKVVDGWATNVNNTINADKAAAQWKITYTLSQVDDNGNPIVAYTYAGNNQTYVWSVENGDFEVQGAFAPTT